MSTLKLCAACRRHVLDDTACPFCARDLAVKPRTGIYVAAAVAAATGLAVTATTLGCVYGADPGRPDAGPDAASDDDAGSDDEDSGS